MGVVEGPPARRLRLRYPATCSGCGAALEPGAEAYWDRSTKRAMCLACVGEPMHASWETSSAGGSAHAHAVELEAKAVARARKKWGDAAAAVAERMAEDDPDIAAWERGAAGESWLAGYIERELSGSVIAIHDRLIPGTRAANIDHIFIAPGGIWVVDAKAYKGKLERRDAGSLWNPRPQVFVNGRNRTKLVDSVLRQAKAVRVAIEGDPLELTIPIYRVLCFLDSDWELLARPFEVRDHVTVIYPKALRDRLRKSGDLSCDDMGRIATRLAAALPPASSTHR